jgi:flagellar protein FlgJ
MTIGPVMGPKPAGVASTPQSSDDARLKKSAQQMEGLFVQQLFKAMRDTVPQGEGAFDASSGTDMFTGLMDEHLAADTPTQWAHGLAAAAYRQLRTHLPGAGETTATPGAASLAASAAPASISLTPPTLKLDSSR